MRNFVVFVMLFILSGCTTFKVVETDADTGYFPTQQVAVVVKSETIDLSSRKELVLVPNGDFTKGMIENIGYFDRVINFEDLEKIIIQEDLTDEVSSISDRIGVNRAAKEYKPFLWIRWDIREDGFRSYQQLILTDPLTLDDYFITETYLDTTWTGITDQHNFYPMMNALIDYLRENSDEE
ncbi:hypothetical protein CWE08_09950 [Aliidiomarina iranensis]|uniref:Uncharacterized protein n=1 Tax=Aliidiomarina iranensis TaxID=1434071 RepID=A0A432VSJ1_9GAMM|nr:hypothetical protein [Aliidiomarina iranensis]RUO19296.1 hypothetical protein CWE08_09950 [Aliidiomarina iranensis]